MNFGEQLKIIRNDLKLTQEQIASTLNVSRQAVSNWENNKNLPDIELIVTISKTYGVSMDRLILGDGMFNNMTEKLIEDGSETRRARINFVSICIGTVLLLIGIACILIKAFSVEYIGTDGWLHENFFLLPIGFLSMFCGVVTFLVIGVRNLCVKVKRKRQNTVTSVED